MEKPLFILDGFGEIACFLTGIFSEAQKSQYHFLSHSWANPMVRRKNFKNLHKKSLFFKKKKLYVCFIINMFNEWPVQAEF